MVTSGKFDPGRWSDRLAQALVSLAEAHECFPDSLGEHAAHYRGTETSSGAEVMVHHYGDALLAPYHGACFRKDREHDERFVRLRTALKSALEILAAHSALTDVAESSSSDRKFAVVIAGSEGETDLLHVLVGLMTRARELPEDGFRIACRELSGLLCPGWADDTMRLNAGFHAVLFHGLRLREEIPITEDMKIVPFETVRAYVDESLLQPFSPNLIVPEPWEPVGAIVKPFEWHPAFHPADDEICLDLDWGGSFREDGERLVELLAITHEAPVVCLVTMHYCVDPVACRLLGRPHHRACYTFGRSAQSFDRLSVSREPCPTALDEAGVLFRARNGAQFRKYEPIIARLAEAAARSGRFAVDDRILDVAMVLERMYELDRGGIAFKLKTRAARFLESETAGRTRVSDGVGGFYKARSEIVHNSNKKPQSTAERKEAFRTGFDIARRTVSKLLRDGPPPDWKDMAIAATGDARSSTGT